jgi:2-polyprenyl-3-methyl-5-hydroxy-6-metoxy-1,4-benzoquinol methylase
MKACSYCSGSSFVFIKKQINGWLIERCTTCGLVQIMPKPSKQAVRALYKHDWPHFSPYQSQRLVHQTYFHTLIPFLLQQIPKKQHIQLLDVGCATGILLSEASNRGIDATGVDISHDAVAYCRKQGLKVIEGTVMEVVSNKLWQKQFDIVTACQVIEHERDPLLFFQTIRRVLVPGGMVIVTTPNHDAIWRKIMETKWIGYQHPEHLFFFTPHTLIAILNRAELQVSVVRSDFSRPYSVGYAFRRLGDYIPGFRWIFQPFERLMKDVQISVPFNPWGDMLLIGHA